MPHDNLIPPTPPSDERSRSGGLVPSVPAGGVEFAYDDEPYRERGGSSANLQRYLWAVWRRKWMLVVALILGAAGAAGAYTFLSVQYTADGHVWVQVDQRGNAGDVGPIQQGELLQSSAWIDLLRSYAVLDPVAVSQHLYLSVPPEQAPAFDSFSLADRFAPGSYVLEVAPDGRRFTLSADGGAVIQRGTLGDSIGTSQGFLWKPGPSAFDAGAEVHFRVESPRDASRTLQDQVRTGMDKNGNFISLSLSGPNPTKIARVLNAVMDQYVEVAARLKRAKLDAQLKILQDQLGSTEEALKDAERNLEDFRVKTITLPSDASTPIAPGLEITQRPVYDRYFQMKVDLEQTRHDREQLRRAVDSLSQGSVRIESLEAVPEVNNSSELKQALDELVQLRSQLRALRNNFTDEYPPIQDLLKRIATLEHQSIPRMTSALITEMGTKVTRLATMVDSASGELTQIPPRTIEEARLRRRVSIQETLYNDLRSRVETAQLASAGTIPDVQILDRATVPQVPTSDQRLRFAIMILFGCLGAAVALAILLDLMNRKIQYAEEVDSEFGLEILGSIPRIRPVASKNSEDNAAQVVEAFRELRVQVSFAHGSAGPVVLAIGSPAAEEGKTLVATNLAVAFAEMGRRTLLIDADTRRGDAHRLLGTQRKPGLTDYLLDRTGGDIIQKTPYEHLEFIGCGTRGSTTPELLASHRMASFFGTLKRAFDVIIIDCPPLAAGADTLVLSGLAGNLAVVLRTGSTDKQLAVAKLDTLSRLPVRVLGAILNDVEPKGSYYRYYSSYLPGYHTQSEEDQQQEEGAYDNSRLLSAQAGAKESADDAD